MSSKQLTTLIVAVVVLALVAGGVLFGLRSGAPAGSTPPTQAPADNSTAEQEASVKLTVAVPNILDSLFTDRLIKTFESAHPGVTVSLVKMDASIPPAAADLNKHLQAVQQYASSADVLYVASSTYLGNTSTLS